YILLPPSPARGLDCEPRRDCPTAAAVFPEPGRPLLAAPESCVGREAESRAQGASLAHLPVAIPRTSHDEREPRLGFRPAPQRRSVLTMRTSIHDGLALSVTTGWGVARRERTSKMRKLIVLVLAALLTSVGVAGAQSSDQGRRLAGPFCIAKTTVSPLR